MNNTVLSVESLTAGYVPNLPILHGVNMHLNNGEIVTIIGPNGAGKSTLIKAVAGLLLIEGGNINLGTKSLVGIAPMKWLILILRMFRKQTIYSVA